MMKMNILYCLRTKKGIKVLQEFQKCLQTLSNISVNFFKALKQTDNKMMANTYTLKTKMNRFICYT